VLVVSLGWAGGAACTEPGDAGLTWAPFVPGQSCEVARVVTGPYCVSCHDGEVEPLDLRAAALGGLVGVVGEYGEPIVVAGDPDASFIVTKVGHPGADLGDPMPPGRALPDAAVEVLRAWISAGAPPCESAGGDIIVGGPVDFGGPPSGFVAVKPSWAAAGACSAGQWWSHPGTSESSSMHPGHDCIGCHQQTGGPGFTYAGTVYPTLYDPDDCRGVPGVTVEILDADGATVGRAVTNDAGSFAVRGRFVQAYRARLSYEGRTREMLTPVGDNGSCNTCHGPSGIEDAPGRVVAP